MLRIAIISSTFPDAKPGGVPTFVSGRSKNLSRRCKVKVFALGDLPKNEGDDQVQKSSIGDFNSFRRYFLIVWLRLFFQLVKYRPTHVEIHNIPIGIPFFIFWRSSYFFHGPAGLEATLEGKSKLSVFLSTCLEVFSLKMSRRVYVVSKSFRNLIKSLHPIVVREKKILVKYPKIVFSLSLNDHLEEVVIGNRPLSLVCVRRLVKRTGVSELVEAYLYALENKILSEDVTLDIVGSGPELFKIKSLIGNYSKGHNIRVHGRLTNKQRSDLYRRADWNIVPTQDLEGFGLVVVEAAFEGCPSMVTNVYALPEVVAELGGIGVVCLKSVQSISMTLGSLCRIPFSERKNLIDVAIKKFSVH